MPPQDGVYVIHESCTLEGLNGLQACSFNVLKRGHDSAERWVHHFSILPYRAVTKKLTLAAIAAMTLPGCSGIIPVIDRFCAETLLTVTEQA